MCRDRTNGATAGEIAPPHVVRTRDCRCCVLRRHVPLSWTVSLTITKPRRVGTSERSDVPTPGGRGRGLRRWWRAWSNQWSTFCPEVVALASRGAMAAACRRTLSPPHGGARSAGGDRLNGSWSAQLANALCVLYNGLHRQLGGLLACRIASRTFDGCASDAGSPSGGTPCGGAEASARGSTGLARVVVSRPRRGEAGPAAAHHGERRDQTERSQG